MYAVLYNLVTGILNCIEHLHFKNVLPQDYFKE